MKSYDERIESIFKKYDERLAEKKRHRSMLIRRAAAVTLGTAAVLVIGIATQIMKPPRKPDPRSSGIITETSAATTDATVTTTALLQTSKASTPQATTTATVTTTTAESRTTAMHTTTTKLTTVGQATISTAKHTTAYTTTQTHKSNSAVSTVISETTFQTTTAAITTAAYFEGSTACVGTELIETNTSAITKKQIVGILDNDYLLYHAACKNNETVSVSTTQLESILYEGEISVTYDVSKYENEHATLYSIKEFSPKFVIAVKTSTDSEPKLYWKYLAEFDTFEELTEGTHLEKNLVLNGIYKGYVEPGDEPIGYPSYSDLAELLNSKESKCIAQNFFPSSVSYIIRVRMPELDDGIGIITVIIQPWDGYGYVAFDVLGVKSLYSVNKDKIDEFIYKFDENYDPTQ